MQCSGDKAEKACTLEAGWYLRQGLQKPFSQWHHQGHNPSRRLAIGT
jgi:hypothetical protein